jgi:hypothetical protein
MFKAIVLCEHYNLSDDQVEYQLRDRLSFIRFLGLGLEDKVPDAKTVWFYREQLAQTGVIEALFEDFDGYLEQQGYLAMGGQIIDASIVPVVARQKERRACAVPYGSAFSNMCPSGDLGFLEVEAANE